MLRPMSQHRLRSLDRLRGVAMVLMALDHVRVYAGVPAGGPTAGVFFTRWVTHFVAPAFAFFAGTAAFLHGRRLGDRAALARYLVERGLLLLVLELTVIRLFWTFNLDFRHYLLAGVIWMLGWCMVLLAALVWLPTPVMGALGLAVIATHGLLPPEWDSPLGRILHSGGPIALGSDGPTLMVLYSIIPWIGVLMAGYAFGAVMLLEPRRRNRILIAIGGSAVALFLVLRGFDLYGDPRPWRHGQSAMPALLRFLNTAKYPASLSFLLMTLGPLILALPLAERAGGRAAEILSTFGRVPLFYYLIHIPVIHLMAIAVALARQGHVEPWLFANHPMMNPPPPAGYPWPLALLYAVYALVVAMLYYPCRWFAGVKASHRESFLRYL